MCVYVQGDQFKDVKRFVQTAQIISYPECVHNPGYSLHINVDRLLSKSMRVPLKSIPVSGSVLLVTSCDLSLIESEASHDLHTHLLLSNSTRCPRQVQLTLPSGVSRQRSPQPPFMCRHGDSSPSITIKEK